MLLMLDAMSLCAVCLVETVMIWRLTVIAVACSLVLVDAAVLYGQRDQRILTFSRSVSDERNDNFHTKRAARSLKSNFVECTIPLSPKEYMALERNTYEVREHCFIFHLTVMLQPKYNLPY